MAAAPSFSRFLFLLYLLSSELVGVMFLIVKLIICSITLECVAAMCYEGSNFSLSCCLFSSSCGLLWSLFTFVIDIHPEQSDHDWTYRAWDFTPGAIMHLHLY